MVVIEDLISTGGSVLEAAEAAEREGATVLGVAAIFTLQFDSLCRDLWLYCGYKPLVILKYRLPMPHVESSTGGSVLEAAEAAEREGATVLGVAAIFTYELPKGTANFADKQMTLLTLTNYHFLSFRNSAFNLIPFAVIFGFTADINHW
jgi:orotate phosphoribosyltransferase